MLAVIYTIHNIINNKLYVGWSKNFLNRKTKHLYELKNNKHKNKYLQNAFNKYGENNFTFEILEEYPIEFILSMEHHWANLLNVHNRNYGYNIRPTHPYGKTINTKEIREKISFNNKGKVHSKESIEKWKISYKKAIEKRKNSIEWIFRKKKISKNKGKKRTEEQKENLRIKMKGKKRNPESIEKSRKSKTGVKLNLSESAKLKAIERGKSMVKMGIFKRNPEVILLFDLNMKLIKEFTSLNLFYKEFELPKTTTYRRLKDGKIVKDKYYIKYKKHWNEINTK